MATRSPRRKPLRKAWLDNPEAPGPKVQAPASPPLLLAEESDGEKKGAGGIEGEAEREIGSKSNPVRKGLPIEVKRFIVEGFACFQDVMTIQRGVVSRFQIALDARTVAQYDAGRPFCGMGRALRTYYDQCRKAYIAGVAEVAVSHQSHRLRLIGRIVDKATTSKDYANAIKGLELAAKEMGGALTGQHTVKHEGMIGHVHATVEEARAEVAARLRQVVEGGTLLPSVASTPTEEGAG